jgi:hypothetical protein
MSSNDEREFRLRPRKPPKPKSQKEPQVWAIAFKRIMHYARMSRSGKKTNTKRAPRIGVKAHFQRCAVRVTYTRNATRGQWGAHGRYVARETATIDTDPKECGFNQTEKGIDIAARLNEWQSCKDQLLWKLILSPEFGDRLDLERLTRATMARMEQDLATRLEWGAALHYNTEHPHVHVALRGVRSGGQQLHISRDYIQHGIRAAAEDFCTRQLGHRTEFDAARRSAARCSSIDVLHSTGSSVETLVRSEMPPGSRSIGRPPARQSGTLRTATYRRGLPYSAGWDWPQPSSRADGVSAVTLKGCCGRCRKPPTARRCSLHTAF